MRTGTEELRHAYRRDGFVVLRGLFRADDVAQWRSEAARLWGLPGVMDDLNLRSECRRDDNGNWVVDRLDPVIDISAVFRAVAMNEELVRVLQELLGASPALLKCKLIRKEPGTGGYLPHQDFRYWQWLGLPPDRLCSVAIALHDCNVASGGIEFFPQLHAGLLPPPVGRPDDDFDFDRIDASRGVTPELSPGDAVVFHSLAPHRSGPNRSCAPRTVLLPSYAAGATPGLYTRYHLREAERRGRELVGFERYRAALASLEIEMANHSHSGAGA